MNDRNETRIQWTPSTYRYISFENIPNKTSIQWTPGIKSISATTTKFWSKMIFEQQNQKNFPEKIFFSEKI